MEIFNKNKQTTNIINNTLLNNNIIKNQTYNQTQFSDFIRVVKIIKQKSFHMSLAEGYNTFYFIWKFYLGEISENTRYTIDYTLFTDIYKSCSYFDINKSFSINDKSISFPKTFLVISGKLTLNTTKSYFSGDIVIFQKKHIISTRKTNPFPLEKIYVGGVDD